MSVSKCSHCGALPKNPAIDLHPLELDDKIEFLCSSCDKEYKEAVRYISNGIREINGQPKRKFTDVLR